MKITFAAVAIGVPVASCAPYLTSYVHLDAPGVTHSREMCREFGPPVAVAYERSGVRFEVSLEPGYSARSKAASLKLRAPRETVISLPDPFARILRPDGGGESRVALELRDKSQRADGFVDYRFEFVGLAPITSPGVLKLPIIDASGVALISPSLAFDRRPYTGVVPLNC